MKQVTQQYSIELLSELDPNKIAIVVDLIKDMKEESHLKDSSWSQDKVEMTIKHTITEPDKMILVCYKNGNPVGLFLGVVESPFFNYERYAREGLWYSRNKDKKSALLMFKAFIIWAKKLGCQKVMSASHEGISNQDKFYKRKGLYPMETHYWGDL